MTIQRGLAEQAKTIEWLKRRFPAACISPAPYNAPFDVTINGVRVEIKCSQCSEDSQRWAFNIHRHGKINEAMVDYYLLWLRGAPRPDRILIPAPIGKYVITVSSGTLHSWQKRSRLKDIALWPYSIEQFTFSQSRHKELTDREIEGLVQRLWTLKGNSTIKEFSGKLRKSTQCLHHIMKKHYRTHPGNYRPGMSWYTLIEQESIKAGLGPIVPIDPTDYIQPDQRWLYKRQRI